jgi:hypothetical protein
VLKALIVKREDVALKLLFLPARMNKKFMQSKSDGNFLKNYVFRMKKLLGFSAVVFLFSMCSTELDLLDDWKETTVVYGLLDQSLPKQYIRIQKAFLGPDNAFDMAQQYDSINYVNQLDVRIERVYNNAVESYVTLSPDTVYNKEPGDFYAPMYVIYSYAQNNTWFNTSYKYRLVINNASTGNEVSSSTFIVGNYAINFPNYTTIGMASNSPSFKPEIKWQSATNAAVYQVMMTFHYHEKDINNNITSHSTGSWFIGSVTPSSTATNSEALKFDADGFYRFVNNSIPDDNNVVERVCDSLTFTVYACGQELLDYMSINGPSSSIAQERPSYTNVTNGLGVFSSRTKSSRSYGLPNQSIDSLSRGRFTCTKKFIDHNGDNFGCQ